MTPRSQQKPIKREYKAVPLTFLAAFFMEGGNGVNNNLALAAPKKMDKNPDALVSTAPKTQGAFKIAKDATAIGIGMIAATHNPKISIGMIEDDQDVDVNPNVTQLVHVYAHDVLEKAGLHTSLFGLHETPTRVMSVTETDNGLVAIALSYGDSTVNIAQPLIAQRTILGIADDKLLLGKLDQKGDVTWAEIMKFDAGAVNFTHLDTKGDAIGVNLKNGETVVLTGLKTATEANFGTKRVNIDVDQTIRRRDGKIAFGMVAGTNDLFALGTSDTDGVTVEYVDSKARGTFAQNLAGAMAA